MSDSPQSAAADQTVKSMVDLLQMESIEENLFRAQNGPGTHVFGGQVLGQAIVAASRTTPPDRSLHSIHGYFLRRGDHARPILFEVDRIRDGRSFTTRRVVGVQHGRAIFNMAGSFQIDEGGLEHQDPMPDVPAPEDLESDWDYYQRLAKKDPTIERFAFRFAAIDSRQCEGIYMIPRHGKAEQPSKNTWMRIKGELPDDRSVHLSLLAYMSDMDFMSTSMLPHRESLGGFTIQGASLDHAMWFHRPFRADDWLLFSKESPTACGARGFVRGRFFDRDGNLVCSAAQECLIRPREIEQSVVP